MPNTLITNREYLTLLKELKTKVANTQIKAYLAVNKQLIMLYWEIGGAIVKAQQSFNWGEQFMQQTAAQIRWGHNMLLMDKKPPAEESLCYIQQTMQTAPKKKKVKM